MANLKSILLHVKEITKFLSSNTARLSEVLPLFTSAVDTVQQTSVTSDVKKLHEYHMEMLVERIEMLRCSNDTLSIVGGLNLTSQVPAEIEFPAIHDKRFSFAVENCYRPHAK